MFGNKLRAWMEAVRPKKKQHRKDKQGKITATINERPNSNHSVTWKSSCLLNCEKKEGAKNPSLNRYAKNVSNEKHNGSEQVSRYSANNLSSPESAYSTGYSTDGTSPGGVPPDYLMNSNSKKPVLENTLVSRLNSDLTHQLPCTSKTFKCYPEQPPPVPTPKAQIKLKQKSPVGDVPPNPPPIFFGKLPEPPGVVSPRQRNRIRTNPWLPGGSTSNIASPLLVKQEVKITPLSYRKSTRNSPIHYRYLSPVMHKRSLSSSSCSSISAGLNHSFEHRVPRSLSDEDDCTLNEMMGKYDESYVYEKETDILSDSDPTDCESDIDTGQDGGDEEDNGDEELDFIDNGSYTIEVDSKTDNTGHCMYIIPPDMQRKRSSRRRTTRRSKEASDRRRKSGSNKKQHKHSSERPRIPYRHSSLHQDGSKSAGATPVSVRRSNLRSNQQKIPEEIVKRRSNSVCLHRDVTVLIEKRDREADLKYKELIGQAEQIIRTMNVNGLSPRRVPGPTNKRVELLRSAECAKPEVLFMSKPNEEVPPSNSNISPSTVTFKNTRFSPKKNHITNFIINNSPVLVRKENQRISPVTARRPFIQPDQGNQTPLTGRRQPHQLNDEVFKFGDITMAPPPNVLKKDARELSPLVKRNHTIKSILHKTDPTSAALLSPRHRREIECPAASSSSEEEAGLPKFNKKLSRSCPQSEPMRRKVYFGRNTINIPKSHGKTVAFNLCRDVPSDAYQTKVLSSENLRHHVLLNTIQNLKRNLEDHSASLQQTYHQKTQTIYKY